MSPSAQRVLRGWCRLSASDQEEVALEIETIRKLPTWEKQARIEKTRSVAPGPLSAVCECCGR
jgi:hypothetical protein